MGRSVASGWYGDPGRTHEVRYWDGGKWTADVSDQGTASVDEVAAERYGPPGSGDRLALQALGLLVFGGAVALGTSLVWGEWMKISPTLAAEDRVWGWGAVLRGLPPAVLAGAVPLVAMVLAVRACRRGSASLGRIVIGLCGLVLFVVSISIIGDLPETVTREGQPGMKWLLLPLSIAIAAGSTFAALRWAKHKPAEVRFAQDAAGAPVTS
jgi:hypothetical protein